MTDEPVFESFWQVDGDSHPIDVHVMPLGDWRDHDSSTGCWCHPTEEDEPCVFVHHALDGRERHEEGAPLH
jgi:hypothetical protein